MQIALSQFEKIDSLLTKALAFPAFEQMSFDECREYIRNENILFDECVVATGYEYANSFATATECAAQIVANGLLGIIDVVDVEAA